MYKQKVSVIDVKATITDSEGWPRQIDKAKIGKSGHSCEATCYYESIPLFNRQFRIQFSDGKGYISVGKRFQILEAIE